MSVVENGFNQPQKRMLKIVDHAASLEFSEYNEYLGYLVKVVVLWGQNTDDERAEAIYLRREHLEALEAAIEEVLK